MHMRSSWRRAAAVVGVTGIIALLVPVTASLAQPPDTAPGPSQSVTIDGPLPVPVQVVGGMDGDGDGAPIPVEVVNQPTGADYVVLRETDATACEFGGGGDQCPRFVSATVAVPEGKDLLVETVAVFFEADFQFVPATAAVQHTSPPFQRYAVGDAVPIEGLTGADGGATAAISFLATSAVTGVIGFPDELPDADSVTAEIVVFGRLIDEPAEE